MAEYVINQLLSSRAILGVSLNFIAYAEPEIPGGGGIHHLPPQKKFLAYNKTQNSQRVKVHEKSYTKLCHSLTYSLTHSLTHSLSLTLDLGKCPKLFYSFITSLFTPFF